MIDNPLSKALQEPGLFEARARETLRDNWAEGFRIAKMHAVVFDTDAGKVLLNYWIGQFLTRPIVRAGEDAFAQGIREGRADIVRQLLVQIEIARTGANLPPEKP